MSGAGAAGKQLNVLPQIERSIPHTNQIAEQEGRQEGRERERERERSCLHRHHQEDLVFGKFLFLLRYELGTFNRKYSENSLNVYKNGYENCYCVLRLQIRTGAPVWIR